MKPTTTPRKRREPALIETHHVNKPGIEAVRRAVRTIMSWPDPREKAAPAPEEREAA